MNDVNEQFQMLLYGNEKALQQILEKYHNYLMVVGSRYVKDRSRVEDLIHDVFADLWNSKKEIELTVSLKSFLRGAVINKCLAIIRKGSKMDYVEDHNPNLISPEPSPDKIYDGKVLKEHIKIAIGNLPDKCRAVFIKSRMEGKSHQEIASELGISTKTIENHMTKALKSLRTELGLKGLLALLILLFFFNG